MTDPFAKDITDEIRKSAGIDRPTLIDGKYCSLCNAEAEVEPGGDENEPPYLFCPDCGSVLKPV